VSDLGGPSRGPFSINGQIHVGAQKWWRVDALGENLAGLEFLMHPFALVGRRVDAERIVRLLEEEEERELPKEGT
jgi:hypothetical protein